MHIHHLTSVYVSIEQALKHLENDNRFAAADSLREALPILEDATTDLEREETERHEAPSK